LIDSWKFVRFAEANSKCFAVAVVVGDHEQPAEDRLQGGELVARRGSSRSSGPMPKRPRSGIATNSAATIMSVASLFAASDSGRIGASSEQPHPVRGGPG
jgi:hypothetical protein